MAADLSIIRSSTGRRLMNGPDRFRETAYAPAEPKGADETDAARSLGDPNPDKPVMTITRAHSCPGIS
jgi:hypothetical protein